MIKTECQAEFIEAFLSQYGGFRQAQTDNTIVPRKISS